MQPPLALVEEPRPRRFDGPAQPHHVVQFYDDDRYLCDAVAQYIGTGLAQGEPCVVIATEAHRRAFVERLRDHSLDLDRACASGNLVLLDAAETLGQLMVGGMPDWHRFHGVIVP